MQSSPRAARLGLIAVALVLFLGLGILGSKAAERRNWEAPLAGGFSLADANGKVTSLRELRGKIIVLIFQSFSCPASGEYADRFMELARGLAGEDRVRMLSIEVGADSVTGGQRILPPSHTLFDRDGRTASKYGVTTTPTVCVIDQFGAIRYQGAFDDNRDQEKVTTRYCENAVHELLSGRGMKTTFTQAFGSPIRTPK